MGGRSGGAKMRASSGGQSAPFLSVPRTVTALIIGAVVMMWFSGALEEEPVLGSDYKSGLAAVAMTFLGYSALQGPSSVMVRPHPVVWKLVHGIAILYLLALVFLLFQGKDEARALLKHLDPALGTELPERAYGTDCRLWIPGEGIHWQVLKDTLFDEFVIAHSLGWIGKAIIMRNYWMLWVCSIGFEFMELTFQHWLLNFNECWWDSWILDVAVCNFGGLLLGMAAVRFFGSKKYDWQGMAQQKGILNKAKRGALQFMPYTFEMWDWAEFSSPKRLLQALTLVAMVLAFELNAFFLKTLFWIPPPHPINILRLLLLWGIGLPGIKEYHSFLEGDSGDVFNKLGSNAWLAAAVLAAEILNIVKLGHGEFTTPFPEHIQIAWGVAAVTFVTGMAIWQVALLVSEYMSKASPKTKKTM